MLLQNMFFDSVALSSQYFLTCFILVRRWMNVGSVKFMYVDMSVRACVCFLYVCVCMYFFIYLLHAPLLGVINTTCLIIIFTNTMYRDSYIDCFIL